MRGIQGICLLLIIFASLVVKAQPSGNGSLVVKVINEGGDPVDEAMLEVGGAGLDIRYQADQQGLLVIRQIPAGTYVLHISKFGYGRVERKITITKGEETRMEVSLQITTEQLDDVTVIGKTETQQAGEQALRATVINTRAASEQPATLAELMNRAPGVRIRQSGGLGNAVDISINGFQGKSVRYFKDGIPLDYLGDGYQIATVPLNLLERVEVYKGVLPVSLGADALGGAVNLVSRKNTGNSLSASYEGAAFNTHRATLSGYYIDRSGVWFAGVDVFFNYSDNDYTATVEVPDEYRNPVSTDVRLFHNAFQSYYAEAYMGVQNQHWADEFRISVASFGIERDQQHPTMMTNPYGRIEGKQRSIVPTLRYRKALMGGKFRIDQFLVYNTLVRNRLDTASGTYDWFGNFTAVPGRGGESPQPANSDIDFSNFTSRSNLQYVFSTNNKLEFNFVHTHIKREGYDPLGPVFLNTAIDVLSIPAVYEKQVAGFGWEIKLLDNKLTNNLMAKGYRFYSRGADTWQASGTTRDEHAETSRTSWGVAEAMKYQLNARSYVRVSVEWANRLPEQDELFGDGEWRVSNFSLRPERSLNVNVGYAYAQPRIHMETNAFYRKTKDIIMLIPTQPPYSQYQNFDNVNGYGLETDVLVPFLRYFTANANFTWQSVRMADIDRRNDEWKNGTRLRNTPFFFANAGVSANFKAVFTREDQIKPYVYFNFVREFYLENIPKSAEPDGFLGLSGKANINALQVVPDQQLWTAGINYEPIAKRYMLGLEVKNIGDTKLYDYYRVQRAGRSFHIKFSYQINN